MRTLNQQRPQILVTFFADAHLWFTLARVPPPGLQPHKASRVATLPEALRVLDGQYIGRGDEISHTLYLL